MTNTETIKAFYAAFAQGDIPFIIDGISDEFTWQDPSNPSIVPFGGSYKGKKGMMDFFHNIGANVNTTFFQVEDYVSENGTIVASGKHGFKVKQTGKDALLDWTMIWKFKNGVPVSGHSYYNNAASEKAFSK